MKPRILLVGYNGADNTGAEAKLLVVIDEIKPMLGECPICPTCKTAMSTLGNDI
jgi:hypothetical protein